MIILIYTGTLRYTDVWPWKCLELPASSDPNHGCDHQWCERLDGLHRPSGHAAHEHHELDGDASAAAANGRHIPKRLSPTNTAASHATSASGAAQTQRQSQVSLST